jgi:hypothetical protein
MFGARQVSAARVLLVSGLAALCGVSSCLYDPNHRCDPGQNFDSSAGLCVCDAKLNLIAGEHGCVACAEHEVAQSDACKCADGYVRPTPSTACALVPNALGNACQSDADCADATYNTCHAVGNGAGYCTNLGCSATGDECSGGYACNVSVTPSYCQRPTVGVGQTCASDNDCAGTEATFCEYLQGKTCYAECSLSKNDCFPGQLCCDLTGPSFGIYKRQICADKCAQ